MSIFTKIFGDPNEKVIKQMQPIVDEINKLEEKIKPLSDAELKAKTREFKDKLANGKSIDDILPEAFAVCREAAWRTLKQRHYDVQLMGGITLHRGQIAEMRTGEGKTLTSTLAVYLNALTGKGVHVVTVNDYLAQRDAVWMGQVYDFLGLTVGIIQHDASFRYDADFKNEEAIDEERDELGSFKIEHEYLRPVERKEAYAADITYGTNNEFGFDYLRDNMVQRLEQMVQRDLNYAIVDEIDSILIDEARTPLIISAPAEESGDLYMKFAQIVRTLRENDDYNVDEKMRAATLTEAGISKVENALGVENIYTTGGLRYVHHIEQALRAWALYKREKDYVVKDGEILIVDEFTGRLMYGRRYSEGLHQAIEAKEGVRVQQESRTFATITFQNLFRMYEKLSGMTGTAATEAEEFSKIYNLEVTSIPTNKPTIRKDMSDKIYKTELAKFKAVMEEVKDRREKGQPCLIGTISIEKNELLSELLEREGVSHQVLNAKQHEKEAEVIAQAGRPGAVTLATNMAGRGVDIILGGNPPDKEEAKKVREAGGLHIIGTERHESRRIDNQLRGRGGRQGDVGSSQFYVSLEDDLMRIFGSDRIKNVMERLGLPDDMPIENGFISKSLESAQKKVEGHNFDIRKHLVEYDDVINKHREVIYKKRRNILDIYSGKVKDIKDEEGNEIKSLSDMVMELIANEIEHLVYFHAGSEDKNLWNMEEIYESVNTIFPIPADLRIKIEDFQVEESETKEGDAIFRTKVIDYLLDLAKKRYEEMALTVNANLGEGAMKEIEKGILLRAVDMLWVEHLEAIDQLRQGIGLRGYGQRDPLVEYKKEAYGLFTRLLDLIQKEVVYSIFKIPAAQEIAPSVMQMAHNMTFSAPSKVASDQTGQFKQLTKGGDGAEKQQAAPQKARDAEGNKVGRNDPCPCGSGKKYKKCCGA